MKPDKPICQITEAVMNIKNDQFKPVFSVTSGPIQVDTARNEEGDVFPIMEERWAVDACNAYGQTFYVPKDFLTQAEADAFVEHCVANDIDPRTSDEFVMGQPSYGSCAFTESGLEQEWITEEQGGGRGPGW